MPDWPFPLADPDDPGRAPDYAHLAGFTSVRVRRLFALARRRRRLAVIDTHLPWMISGFRYHEFEEMHRRRPDTLFFSLYRCTDPFPTDVHPLERFPEIAPSAGVTDVYMVFMNLAASLLGVESDPRWSGTPGARSDLSIMPILDRYDMRAHATIYPGGGYQPGTNLAAVREVGRRCATVFAFPPELLSLIPNAVPTEGPVPGDFYSWSERHQSGTLHLVFVGDDNPRKGLSVLLDAYEQLGSGFSLDVVGPHDRYRARIEQLGATLHGWLAPPQLREVLSRAEVIVAPATRDLPEDGYGDTGMIDGFPTVSAYLGMLTGCALVGSNPLADHSRYQPEEHYLEVAERDVVSLVAALRRLAADRVELGRLARNGAAAVRARCDVKAVVASKLAAMQLA